MSAETSAGTLFKISAGLPATYNAAGFEALTFTPVGEITDYGEFGRKYNLVKHNPVATRKTVKRKGSYDAGSMTIPMALDNDDAGQIIMKAAAASDASYSVCIELKDGFKFYFTVQVMQFLIKVGSVDSITQATAMLELDDDVVEDAP